MSDQIRWGILSTAKIGREKVIPAIHKSRNGVVAAVASRDLERARAFADETGIPTAYGSYEELLADPNIDAIYNPLPNSGHAPWSIACAEAGKPSLCEKPLAADAPEAQTMVDAFAARGILFAEAFMYRFHPQTEAVLDLVRSGFLGELRSIDSTFTFSIDRESNIRLDKSLAGGALMDVGCYCVNVMRLMTGEEPVAARAFARIGAQSQVDETLCGVLDFPSGVIGHFDCSFRAMHIARYDLHGSAGPDRRRARLHAGCGQRGRDPHLAGWPPRRDRHPGRRPVPAHGGGLRRRAAPGPSAALCPAGRRGEHGRARHAVRFPAGVGTGIGSNSIPMMGVRAG